MTLEYWAILVLGDSIMKLYLLLSFLFTNKLFAQDLPPALAQVVWSCNVPCVSGNTDEVMHKTVQVGICRDSVGDAEMFDLLTPVCRTALDRKDVRAVAVTKDGFLPYLCTTVGNSCSKKGLIKLNFSCVVKCEGDLTIRSFGTCAANDTEAWKAAVKVCPNPTIPDVIQNDKPCQNSGQTACE